MSQPARTWTAADDARIRTGKAKGESNETIAQALECSPRAVRVRWTDLRKADPPPKPKPSGGHREIAEAARALALLQANLHPEDPDRAQRIAQRRQAYAAAAARAHEAAMRGIWHPALSPAADPDPAQRWAQARERFRQAVGLR
jgi:hypothetical protein